MDNIDRFLDLKEVKQITGLSRSSIYSYVQKATFPKSVLIGKRKVGWIKAEVDAWVAAKISAARTNH